MALARLPLIVKHQLVLDLVYPSLVYIDREGKKARRKNEAEWWVQLEPMVDTFMSRSMRSHCEASCLATSLSCLSPISCHWRCCARSMACMDAMDDVGVGTTR